MCVCPDIYTKHFKCSTHSAEPNNFIELVDLDTLLSTTDSDSLSHFANIFQFPVQVFTLNFSVFANTFLYYFVNDFLDIQFSNTSLGTSGCLARGVGIKLAQWNASALFFFKSRVMITKLKYDFSTLNTHDILCIQESHGSLSLLQLYFRRFSSFSILVILSLIPPLEVLLLLLENH